MEYLLIQPTEFNQYDPIIRGIDFGDQGQFVLSCAKYIGLIPMSTKKDTCPCYSIDPKYAVSWEQRIVYEYNTKPLIPIGITGWYLWKIGDNYTLWLSWFGIIEKYQKMGIGKEILQETIYILKGLFDYEYLYVFTDNAKDFYVKCGFEYLGTSKEVYGENNNVTYSSNDFVLRIKLK